MASEHYSDEWLQVWVGDCRDALRQMPEKSVHTCITSPPYYGLREYQTATWEGGDPECDHRPASTGKGTNIPQTKNPAVSYPSSPHRGGDPNLCGTCGALRVEPTTWGGDVGHEHEWGAALTFRSGKGPQGPSSTLAGTAPTDGTNRIRSASGGNRCECGAWRGALGLEPSPDEYAQHLVDVFAEVKRVLRDDGVLWLNLGDSYAGGGGYSPNAPSNQRGSKQSTQKGAIGGSVKPQGDIKAKDLLGIPWMVAFALRKDGWYLRSDIVWCLSGGSRVYARTPSGDRPVTLKDLARMDPNTVLLWNGEKWTRLLGMSRVERPDGSVEVEFRSGERVGCTPNHRWPTERGTVAAEDLVIGDVVSTTTFPEPVHRSPMALDDDLTGWFVGMYLAEGSRSGTTLQFAGHMNDPKRFSALDRVASAFDGTCRIHQTSENGVTSNVTGPLLLALVDTYLSGRTAIDKHIGARSWGRSNDFLAALMRGYLEGDGHYEAKNRRWRIGFTNNDQLAADLRTICARLGYRIRLRRAKSRIGDRTFPGWRGEIRETVQDHPNRSDNGQVVAIRRSRARQFWHLGVEDEPHTFALASGLMTCNSKPNAMPESVEDRPSRSHEFIFMLTKQPHYFYDHIAVKQPATVSTIKTVTARMANPIEDKEYQHDSDVRMGKRSPNRVWSDMDAMQRLLDGRNLRDVWNIPTVSYSGSHYAVFPPKLVEPMIKAATSEKGVCGTCGGQWVRQTRAFGRASAKGGAPHSAAYGDRMHGMDDLSGAGETGSGFAIIAHETTGWEPSCEHTGDPVPATCLDPFGGSGTTAMVAQSLGRRAILIDLNDDYVKQQMKRNAQVPLGLGF